MKTNLWLVCGSLLCCGALAQQSTNAPSASPPIQPPVAAPALATTLEAVPATAPAARPPAAKKQAPTAAKKKTAKATAKAPVKPAAKKPAFEPLKTIPLVPGPATVIASNVNVRGQAKLKSEVVARLAKGQEVTVIEEVLLKKSAPDEPSAWAKILLPPNTRVWVHSMFIEADSKKVKPRRLNVRSGPGENYSVLGTLERGQIVQDSQVKEDWLQIEPPANAYAFVAAQYLKQEAPAIVASSTSTAPPSTPALPPAEVQTTPPPATTNIVTEAPKVAAAPAEAPAVPATTTEPPAATAPAPADSSAGTNLVAATESKPEQPAEDEPLPPRIVQHEGIVRGSGSIQAPTRFELFSPESGRLINYLYVNPKDLDLGRYKGLRVIATGEEGLDARWRNTPVLSLQHIKVLE